jgi:hypothetical protein
MPTTTKDCNRFSIAITLLVANFRLSTTLSEEGNTVTSGKRRFIQGMLGLQQNGQRRAPFALRNPEACCNRDGSIAQLNRVMEQDCPDAVRQQKRVRGNASR